MELDTNHPAFISLKELLPVAYISGGSFASYLPLPISMAPDARRDELIRNRQTATSICLGALLTQLPGKVEMEIHHGSGGEILWPSKFVGSLSHKGTVVLAAMIDQESCPALGLDLERVGQENMSEIETVVAPEGLPPNVHTDLGTLIAFSAKESVFKAQYPMTKARLEYEDVRLEWIDSGDQRLHIGNGYCGQLRFSVRVLATPKWLVSVATL
jgi:4'-phosphopantetheinyl transferase EntD